MHNTIYRNVGHSGLRVYPLGLGTMQFGWSAPEAEAFAVMDTYWQAGGNFIDTADIYSAWVPGNPGGVSEEVVGRWLQARGNRNDIVLATKVRGPMGQDFSEGPNHIRQRAGLSRRWVLQACEDSLRRLQVDHIDLYQVHYIDPLTPIEETLSALTDLVRKGYVRYIGCSNFSAWRLMQALWASEKGGYEKFISVQPEYSLLSPTRANFERELLPVCRAYGVGVVPYSPLGGGLLTGKYRRGQALPDSVRAGEIAAQRFSEQNFNTIDTLVAIAERHQAQPAQVALAWMLAQPGLTAPIVGANTPAQLQGLLGAVPLVLAPQDVAEISRVSDWTRARTELEN